MSFIYYELFAFTAHDLQNTSTIICLVHQNVHYKILLVDDKFLHCTVKKETKKQKSFSSNYLEVGKRSCPSHQ